MNMPTTVYKLPFVKIGENQLDRSCEKRKGITRSQERDEYPIYKKKKKKGYVDWPHIVQELPSKTVLKEKEGRIDVMGTRGRRRKQLKDDRKEKTGYWKFKEKVRDRALWRTRFGRRYGLVVRHTTEWTFSPGSTPILERKREKERTKRQLKTRRDRKYGQSQQVS
jgi:hypothetical protein